MVSEWGRREARLCPAVFHWRGRTTQKLRRSWKTACRAAGRGAARSGHRRCGPVLGGVEERGARPNRRNTNVAWEAGERRNTASAAMR